MKTLLWLDDIRNPFVADWRMQYAPQFAYGEGETTWVKSYDEFTKWITENGLPYMIAFDHDLGQDVANDKVAAGMSKRKSRREKRTEMSGFECAKWLVDYCIDNDIDFFVKVNFIKMYGIVKCLRSLKEGQSISHYGNFNNVTYKDLDSIIGFEISAIEESYNPMF